MSRKPEPQLIDLAHVLPKPRHASHKKGKPHSARRHAKPHKYVRKNTRYTMPDAQWCESATNAGTDCPNRAPIVTIKGKRYQLKTCVMHAPQAIKDYLGVGRGGTKRGAGRKKIPTPQDVMRQRIEADVARYLQPYEDALGAVRAVVVGNGASAHIEFVDDLGARVTSVEKLFDRAYGKPKQQVELGGGDSPIEIEIPSDMKRQQDVAAILADSGALGTVIPGNPSKYEPSNN